MLPPLHMIACCARTGFWPGPGLAWVWLKTLKAMTLWSEKVWIAHVKQRKEGSSILRSAVVKAYMIAWNLKQISHSRTTTGEKILTLSTPISMASCTQQCETLVTLPLDKGFSGSNLAEVVRLIKSSATNVSPRPWLWERSPALYRRRAQPESERWRLRLRSKLFKISLIAERLQAQAASSNSLPSWWYKTSWTSLPCCANHPTVPSSFKERSFWASEIARYGNAGIFGNQCFFF